MWRSARTSIDGHGPDENVQYRIGSITKTFTAVTVLQLRDEGLLDLEDPLEKHAGHRGGRPRSPSCSRALGRAGRRVTGAVVGADAGLTLRPELADVLGERPLLLHQ